MGALARVDCKTCGKPFVQERGERGGRPAVHCEACRRDPATRKRDNDSPEHKARRNAQDRARAESTARAKSSASEDELVRMAVSLSLVSDPTRAADSAGIATLPDAAARLADEARTRYGEIVDPTNMQVVGRLARAAMIEAIHTLRRRMLDVPPGQLANVLRAMEAVYGTISASDGAPRYASIELCVIGPDGQKAKVE